MTSNLEQLRTLTQKMADRQLLVSQILNNIPDLVVAGKGDGILGMVNMACESILGWKQSEMQGRPWAEFVHPDDVQSTKDIVASARVSATTIYGFVNRYRRKDGTFCYLSWNIKPKNEDGYLYSTARVVQHGC